MDRTSLALGNFRIVALCGSSGSLMPCLEILRAMPHESGMAFVVLIHRRSGSVRQLVTVLSSATHIPVQQIENLSALLPNRVYVMPAGMDLTSDGTEFRLAPISVMRGLPNGFDIFLTSLAKNTKDRVVTIILSGLASDGSAALGDSGSRVGSFSPNRMRYAAACRKVQLLLAISTFFVQRRTSGPWLQLCSP